jgi:hypothetical protein
MRFRTVQTLPAQPHKLTGYEQLDEKFQERFDKIVHEFLERNKPMHQLLGHAVPIQSAEMALECQLVSNGLYCGDGRGYHDPRAEKLARGSAGWLLLAMIDTGEPRGWMWGDGGCLYFWSRRDDLQTGRFENVWMIMQCLSAPSVLRPVPRQRQPGRVHPHAGPDLFPCAQVVRCRGRVDAGAALRLSLALKPADGIASLPASNREDSYESAI